MSLLIKIYWLCHVSTTLKHFKTLFSTSIVVFGMYKLYSKSCTVSVNTFLFFNLVFQNVGHALNMIKYGRCCELHHHLHFNIQTFSCSATTFYLFRDRVMYLLLPCVQWKACFIILVSPILPICFDHRAPYSFNLSSIEYISNSLLKHVSSFLIVSVLVQLLTDVTSAISAD